MLASRTNSAGIRRVVAFLASLDEATAARVLETLPSPMVTDVALALSEHATDSDEPAAVDVIYHDLARELRAPRGWNHGSPADLAHLLSHALGAERARDVLATIDARRRAARPFTEFESAPTHLVVHALQSESSAVAALVLSHLDPRVSSAVLSGLDPDRALDVTLRMARLDPPDAEVVAAVAAALRERLVEPGSCRSAADPSERLRGVARMLNLTDKTVERHVLEGLERADKSLVGEIREHMFTWDDLATLDKRGMQRVLSSIETRSLAVALKACPPDVEANVFANLSARVRAMVVEERDLAGAIPMAEVSAARAEILRSVRALLESGELAPTRPGERLVR